MKKLLTLVALTTILAAPLAWGAISQDAIDGLNRMNGHALKYGLGTLINDAEDAAPADGAITTAKILDANVTAAKLADNTAVMVTEANFAYTDIATSGVEFNCVGTVPDNAVVHMVIIDVLTTMSDSLDTDLGVIEIGLGAAGTSDNVFDSAVISGLAAGFVAPTDTNSPGQAFGNLYKMSADSTVNVKWTVNAAETLDAGDVNVYVFWTQGD